MVKPTITGTIRAMAPGSIISRMAALVEMATQRPYSGIPVPSRIPGISRNWRRTSCTIAIAARPTAAMASDEKMKGIIAPTNRPPSTRALEMSMTSIPEIPMNAAKSASEVSAAEAMAKPLPVAAVVLPTASRMSVRWPHLGGKLAHLRDAARVVRDGAEGVDGQLHRRRRHHPRRGDRHAVQPRELVRADDPAASTRMGSVVDSIPIASPLITLVAWPVADPCTMLFTGRLPIAV
jgi:hypothetical protein